MQSQDACCFCISSVLLEFLTWVQTGSWRYCSCRGRPCSWGLKPANFCESVPCTRHECKGIVTWRRHAPAQSWIWMMPAPCPFTASQRAPLQAGQYYWNPQSGKTTLHAPVGFPDNGGVIRDMAPLLTQPFWTMKTKPFKPGLFACKYSPSVKVETLAIGWVDSHTTWIKRNASHTGSIAWNFCDLQIR